VEGSPTAAGSQRAELFFAAARDTSETDGMLLLPLRGFISPLRTDRGAAHDAATLKKRTGVADLPGNVAVVALVFRTLPVPSLATLWAHIERPNDHCVFAGFTAIQLWTLG
jgi:hypothetical protein